MFGKLHPVLELAQCFTEHQKTANYQKYYTENYKFISKYVTLLLLKKSASYLKEGFDIVLNQ